MKNGFSASQLNLLRTRPQSADWYLAIHKPRTMGNFTITNIENYTGSLIGELGVLGANDASAIAGQTGVVYDTNGSWLGDIRIRKDWPGNPSVLAIAEAGSGLINWASSSTIKVLDQWRPWIKHPRSVVTDVWMMDFDVVYDGQLYQYRPYSNPGAPIVALPTSWVDIGEGGSAPRWVVDFYGDQSFNIGRPINANEWIFPDGQTVTSVIATSAAPIKMTFTGASPGGSYYSLKVTADDGTSHIGRRLIFAVNSIDEFPKVQVSDISGGVESGGYQARFLATGNPQSELTESAYPYLDNSEVIVFERGYYGGNQSSIGGNSAHRESTIFRGWIKEKELRASPFASDMYLTAETVNGVLNEADSYDIFLATARGEGSGSWIEPTGLTLDIAAEFALKWRSTVSEICDFKPMGEIGSRQNIFYQDLPRGNFFDQLRTNYHDRGVLGYFSSDLQSNLFAFQDAQLTGTASALPTVVIADEDKRDLLTITTPTRDLNSQVVLYAVTSDIPYGAESPGHVRGYFGGERTYERGLLAESQDQLIAWTGRYRAKLNNKFPRVTVPVANNMRIDPVPQSVVNLSLAASDNARGIQWTNERFITKDLSVSYDATIGYPLWELGLEKETIGIGGSPITFPTIDDLVPVPTNPPPPGTVPFPTIPPGTETFGGGFGTVYVLVNDKLYRTRDFSATSPVWTLLASTGYDDFILDPWSPATTGYLLADGVGVYKSVDLDQTTPSFSLILSDAQIQTLAATPQAVNGYIKIIGSINTQGFLAFVARYGTFGQPQGLVYFYSLDSGTTWSKSIVANTGGRQYASGMIDIVPHLVSGEMVLYATSESNTAGIILYKSTNGGVSWSQEGVKPYSGSNRAVAIHCPYEGNEAGNICYWSQGAVNNIEYLFRTVSGITSEISPATPVAGFIPKRWTTETYTQDNQICYTWLDDDLYISDDAGDTWTPVSYSGLPAGGFSVYSTGGFPSNSSQFYLVLKTTIGSFVKVFVSTDRGSTWTEKTGNLSEAAGSMLYTAVVPLWTE